MITLMKLFLSRQMTFYFSTNTLYDLALKFYQQGGKKLYIDEIHKYQASSREIKNIYDQIPELNVIYTGSSILDLEQGGAIISAVTNYQISHDRIVIQGISEYSQKYKITLTFIRRHIIQENTIPIR